MPTIVILATKIIVICYCVYWNPFVFVLMTINWLHLLTGYSVVIPACISCIRATVRALRAVTVLFTCCQLSRFYARFLNKINDDDEWLVFLLHSAVIVWSPTWVSVETGGTVEHRQQSKLEVSRRTGKVCWSGMFSCAAALAWFHVNHTSRSHSFSTLFRVQFTQI